MESFRRGATTSLRALLRDRRPAPRTVVRRACAKLVGYLREVHGADRFAELKPHIDAALAGTPVQWARGVRGSGGERHWFDVNYEPYRGPDGLVLGALVLVTDVSESKRVKSALRDSEAWFRALVETTSIGIAVVGPDGRVQLANDADSAFLGYDRDQLVGMQFSEFTHPDDLHIDGALFAELLRGHPCELQDRRALHKAPTRPGRRPISRSACSPSRADR